MSVRHKRIFSYIVIQKHHTVRCSSRVLHSVHSYSLGIAFRLTPGCRGSNPFAMKCVPSIQTLCLIKQLTVCLYIYLDLNIFYKLSPHSHSAILGAFTRFREAAISVVMSPCPSVRPFGTTRLPLNWFSWNSNFQNFSKNLSRKSGSIKFWEDNVYFTWRPIYTFHHIPLSLY